MIVSPLSLAVEGMVSILLVVMIVYASRLNRRLADLRGNEGELQEGIARFNEAAARAEAAAFRLKAVGTEAERTVRLALERANAVRDELIFLSERTGEAPTQRRTRSATRPGLPGKEQGQPGSATDRPARQAEADGNSQPEQRTRIVNREEHNEGALRSSAERELLKAIRAAHGAR